MVLQTQLPVRAGKGMCLGGAAGSGSDILVLGYLANRRMIVGCIRC
jgi:hypothetical protein